MAILVPRTPCCAHGSDRERERERGREGEVGGGGGGTLGQREKALVCVCVCVYVRAPRDPVEPMSVTENKQTHTMNEKGSGFSRFGNCQLSKQSCNGKLRSTPGCTLHSNLKGV
jgi:predicted metalloprotease